MKGTIQLGKIAGIAIGLHYSWFIIAGLVTWSLARGFLPALNRDWTELTYWVTGVFGALLLFVSVLLHELAHSLVAKARGFEVGGITLFVLGGVSNLRADARHARDEFIIAAVGPASSLLLAAVFWVALLLIPDGPRTPAIAVLMYLTLTNLLLAAFNMVPAFPLDGGRVLRSILWGATGNISMATRVAAWGGQIVGFLMIGYGLYQVFQDNAFGGVWLAVIGWFLQSVARASMKEHRVSSATRPDSSLRRIGTAEAMQRFPQTIGPDATVYDAVYGGLWRYGLNALPVLQGGDLVGIVTLTNIRSVPTNLWPLRHVGEIMTRAPLKTAHPDDDLSVVIGLLERNPIGQVPIVEGGRLVGLISRADVIRHLNALGALDDSLKRSLGIYAGD